MTFAQWLQEKMGEHGFSNYRIAKMAGVHQSSVAGWLSGAKPQAEKEILVRNAIRDYEEKLGSPSPKKSPAVSGEGLDATTRQLFDFVDGASDSELLKVLDYIEFIKSQRNTKK